jgi:uncharacterized protein YhaN
MEHIDTASEIFDKEKKHLYLSLSKRDNLLEEIKKTYNQQLKELELSYAVKTQKLVEIERNKVTAKLEHENMIMAEKVNRNKQKYRELKKLNLNHTAKTAFFKWKVINFVMKQADTPGSLMSIK